MPYYGLSSSKEETIKHKEFVKRHAEKMGCSEEEAGKYLLEEFPLSLFSQNIKTMGTAQIICEQYKVLPKRIREELKALIVNEYNQEQPLTYAGD